MTLESYIEMIVVQRVNRKSCIWYNMYLCSGINKISHLLETSVSDPSKDKYVADFLGSHSFFSHQMKIKYQPKRTISEKIVKAVSVYGITNVKKWLIEETAKNEDIDIETMRAISEGLFDAFHDKEKHVAIITNPNHYYLSNELDLFREYVSLKHNFSSQEIENNFDLLMTLESYKYIEMIVVQRVNRKSCVWYNMYLCSGINKISHLLETGVSHPCQYKYVADFLGSPPFFFPPDDDQISTRRQDFREIVKAVSVYGITNVKKWLIEETAKNEDIDIETVRAISEGLFDAFNDKKKHVTINTNPNCYYLSNVLDLFREYVSLKYNFSSQEIENDFDLLMTLESYIVMIVVQRVNRKSCIWYNMYLCSGINKISHLLETGVSDPCKYKYVADFLCSPPFFSHQMMIKYQPKGKISEKIVKAVSVYGITNVKKWLIKETAKNEDSDIETLRAISEGLFDAFPDKEKHVDINTNPNCYYLSNVLDLFREYVSLKHNFSSQEIENNFDLLMTLESYIEMIVVQRVNRKSCIWYNMYLCSGINKISHLLETGVSDPCKDKYVADFLGSPPFISHQMMIKYQPKGKISEKIVKVVSVYGIINVKKWLIEETAKNEDIDIETVRAISEGLFDVFHDKEKHVAINTNPNCYYLSNVLDLFREYVSLKHNFSSQEIENNFDLLMTLERYIEMLVVQRVNRKSCIWYNMYLCSGINKQEDHSGPDSLY